MSGPVQPLDSITHRGNGTLIGAFRCPVGDPRFQDSGPIQNDIFVFPRATVRIRHAGGPSFVADPSVATVYNRGQSYDRRAISEEGDRSDWFAVPRETALEAVTLGGLEPSAHGPFSFPWVPIDEPTYARQRRLFRAASRGGSRDAIDEAIYGLLVDIVRGARGSRPRRRAGDEERRARDIAEAVRTLLSARFDEKWTLVALSARVGVSPFALCRAFRKTVGMTIHRFQTSLRLRASLERLEAPRADLTGLALDLGFSSHSHFAMAFRRAFAAPPSTLRRALAGF